MVKLANAETAAQEEGHARGVRRHARGARRRGRARRGGGCRPDRLHHHQEARRRGLRRAPVQLRHRRAEHDRRGGGPLAGRQHRVHGLVRRVRHRARLRPDPQHRVLLEPEREDRPHARGRLRGPRRRLATRCSRTSRSCAVFRSMRVLVPADYAAARAALRLAAATPGPVYVRMGRASRAVRVRRRRGAGARPRLRAARGRAMSPSWPCGVEVERGAQGGRRCWPPRASRPRSSTRSR